MTSPNPSGVTVSPPGWYDPHNWGPAAAVSSPPTNFLLPANALAETFPRKQCNIGTGPGNAQATLTAIPLNAGMIISTVTVITGNTAQVGGTHSWAGLADSGFVLRAVSADATSNFFTPNATAFNLSMVIPYTVPADGLYYIVLSQSATTPANFCGFSGFANAMSFAPLQNGFIVGQSAPPAVGTTLITPTGNGSVVWAMVS